MPRLVVELTNRCNLQCHHCFDARHGGRDDLAYEIVRRLLADATSCGVRHVSFTGGEPTLHRRFRDILGDVADAGCTFSFVSNGSTFPHIYPWLVDHRRSFLGATFSVDGSNETTHDQLRGRGSFRDVMRAASICVARQLPFTINVVITRQNMHEIADCVLLAASLRSGGVRFGHLMPGPGIAPDLALSLAERRAVEQEIWAQQRLARIPVGMAPGYYSESPFFPCGPLELQEFNVDCRGNVTLCCHLSGNQTIHGDSVGNLAEIDLKEAFDRLAGMVQAYLATKRAKVEGNELGEQDHWPCLYCVRHFEHAASTSARAVVPTV